MPIRSGVFWSETGQGRMGAAPWEDAARFIENSPIAHLDQLRAPVLLIAGDMDKSVSITHSEEIFTGLARQDRDVKFIRYWGEAHGILRPQNVRHMWENVFLFLEEAGVSPANSVE